MLVVWEKVNNYIDWIVMVVVWEYIGIFYWGCIIGVGNKGGWEVLVDDGDLVLNVMVDMFVLIWIVDKK